jgi:segregation and condensation protein B
MSKRKGRKPALNSEIKSIMRAPDEAESELEGPLEQHEGKEAAQASDDDELLEDESLPLDVLSEVGAGDEGALLGPPPEEPSESSVRPPKRSRRSSIVAARASEVAVADLDDEASTDDSSAEQLARGSVDYHVDARAAAERDDAEDGATPDSAVRGEDSDEDEDEDGGERPSLPPFPIDADGDDTENFLRGLVEALLFTSQKPLDLKDIARSAGVDRPRAKELVEQLVQIYEGRGLCIEEVAGGFVMRSSARYAPYIQKILALRPVRLSRAQLETLAIVAYRQPVTKPEVDDIRGVDSGQVIKGLLERSLLKMLGKKDEPGRPTLYGTTNDFLELLNLQSLKDLPTLREYTELSEESQRKFLEETGEAVPNDTMSFERPPSHGGDSVIADPMDGGDSADADATTADDARTDAADHPAQSSAGADSEGAELEPSDDDDAVELSDDANESVVADSDEVAEADEDDADEDDADEDDADEERAKDEEE